MKLVKFYKVYQSLQSLSGCYLEWSAENVCNSLANHDGITKLAAIILIQATLNFQNVYDSLGNNNSFYKNVENSLRFQQISCDSLDENHKKEGTTTKGPRWRVSFLYTLVAK